MSTHHSNIEKLNMLGAGLITAITAHGLLCLASLSGIIAAPTDGWGAMALKIATLAWAIVGMMSAAYAGWLASFIIRGKSLAHARKAALLALILPLVGTTGGITAFALLPVGALAFLLFRSPEWKGAFADHAASDGIAEPVVFECPDGDHHDLAA